MALKRHPIVATLTVLLMALGSCKKDYLSFPYTDGSVRQEDIFRSDKNARGFLNNAYFGLLNRYNIADGAMLASATDEAVNSDLGNTNPGSTAATVNIFHNGRWSSTLTLDDQYANMYDFLRRTNLFLENAPGSGIAPKTDVAALMGEAYFLRAYYHFQLFQRYGAIVLAKKSFASTDNLDVPKNSVDEVVAQIGSDCDSAALLIPSASITDQTDTDKGRATKAAALALKSRLLLYAASPLNNPSNDAAKWKAAANAAKVVIDLNKHALLPAAQINNVWNYSTNPFNTEVILATSPDNINTVEKNNAPISYDAARGRNNPTQDLVDAFEMRTTGKPITDPTSGYVASNPYSNRDPRLAAFIMANASIFKTKTVDTYVTGKDNLASNINSTRTGYYLRKFLSEQAAWPLTGTQTNVRRPWVIFRYAEMLLNYAEVLNESDGPVADVYTYVNQVRTRAGMPNLPAGLSQAQMRDRLQNERRVELCFEDHRFFDVRRWKKGEQFFNKPVSGMNIAKNGTTFTYAPFQVETRSFTARNYLFPFPQSELNKTTKLVQNPGW